MSTWNNGDAPDAEQAMTKENGGTVTATNLKGYVVARERAPMSLLGGERLVYQAAELRCCNSCNRGVVDEQGASTPLTKDTGIMLTDRRIVFHWVRKVLFCLPSTEQEENFSYSDVQFVWVSRGISYFWLWLGIMCLGAGIALLAVGGSLKKGDPNKNMFFGIGAGLLVLGLLMMIIFVIMLFLAGMYLNFSFSRNSNVSIQDWHSWSVAGKAPSTKRWIKLTPEAAHAAMYTILSHPLVYNAKIPHGSLECL